MLWNWLLQISWGLTEAMINVFRALPSNPRIFVATNSKAFSNGYGISESTMADSIRPDELQIAAAMGTSIIDIYDTSLNYSALYADGIHPGIQGSAILASKVYNLVTAAIPQITNSGSVLSAPAGANAYQWYLNGVPVSGGTNQTFTITTAGTYAVGLKLNNRNQDRLMSSNYVVPGTLAVPAAPTGLVAGAGN